MNVDLKLSGERLNVNQFTFNKNSGQVISYASHVPGIKMVATVIKRQVKSYLFEFGRRFRDSLFFPLLIDEVDWIRVREEVLADGHVGYRISSRNLKWNYYNSKFLI